MFSVVACCNAEGMVLVSELEEVDAVAARTSDGLNRVKNGRIRMP